MPMSHADADADADADAEANANANANAAINIGIDMFQYVSPCFSSSSSPISLFVMLFNLVISSSCFLIRNS
jgi:hypothetical protein